MINKNNTPKVSLINSLSKLLIYTKNKKLLLSFALLFAIISSSTMIFLPSLIGNMTTLIYKYKETNYLDFDKLILYSILLFCIIVLSTTFNYIQSILFVRLNKSIVIKLRNDISKKINKLPLKYFDNNQTGDIISRVTNDVDTISQSLQQTLSTILTSTSTIVGFLVIMFVREYRLALVVLIIVPLSSFFVGFIVRKSQKYFKNVSINTGEITGIIEEVYSSTNIIKAYNAGEVFNEKFKKCNEELYKNTYKSQFLSNVLMPFTFFIGNIGYIIIAFYGALLHLKHNMDIGKIQEFIMYIRRFNMPINQLAQNITVLQQAAAASDRIFEFLNEEEEPLENQKINISNIKGKVEFRNVSFSYNEKTPVIKNLSQIIYPGQTVAIVGHTGAGKTTLVNLLMRFYNINSGDIFIDDINIKDLTKSQTRKLFSMVLQDTWLFKGSIKENIAYNDLINNKEIDMHKVKEIAVKAEINHYILSLPNGYDEILDEDLENISIGQKQLFTIARAMYQETPMIILDEATSNVDTRTEVLIQKALKKLSSNKTSFIIAHRLSTIKEADLILVVDKGNIIEKGTHEELLNNKGYYYDLYNSQFEEMGD